jgi:hypothetical protein
MSRSDELGEMRKGLNMYEDRLESEEGVGVERRLY